MNIYMLYMVNLTLSRPLPLSPSPQIFIIITCAYKYN